MESPQAGPPAWYDWRSIKWRRNKNGYYQDDNGNLLHRELWKFHVGPLDDGTMLHHRDHDKSNNAIDNLKTVTRAEHCGEHPEKQDHPDWVHMQSSDGGRQRANKLWDTRKPVDVACDWCGTVFQSTGMRAKFCGGTCRARRRRAERRALLDQGGHV
jgi:hypothetical protein